MTPRNIAILAGGAIALVTIGYFSGRRVEADSGKAGLTNVSSEPLVPAHSTAQPRPVNSATPAASALAKPDTSSAHVALGDLFTRLEEERKGRLNLEPTADHVFAALKSKAGIEVEEQLQVAGWTINAKFCDKVRTTKDVHIVICEFADEAAATKGQADAYTAGLKRRVIVRNKTTTCAIHQAGEGPGAAEQAAKVKGLFLAM